MAKKVAKIVKIQIEAGKATMAPPVGTALGPTGINLQEFCTRYNDATKDKMGDIVPVEISIYEDRTFDFVLKTPPASTLILKYANIAKGSKKGANETVATISKEDLKKIAEIKLPDLNAYNIEEAMEIVSGTARNMGIAVKGVNDQELAQQAADAQKAEADFAKMEEELTQMEADAKAMAEEDVPEVEVSEQSEEGQSTEEETKE